MSSVASTASVPTANGARYLQQLCKHWSHNLQVEFTAERGTIVFPKERARRAAGTTVGLRAAPHPICWKRSPRDSRGAD